MTEKSKTPPSPFDQTLLGADASVALGAAESAGARAVELVEAWVKQGNVAAVAVVAERGSGALRKAARRGLNVLKSRGAKLESSPRVGTVALSERDRESVTEAWFVPPDSMGSVLIVLASRSPTSRAKSGFFYLHDSVGLHSASVGSLSGSALKEALKRAAEAGPQPVRVPLEYARYRVALGRQELKSRNAPEPLGMINAADLLEPAPSEAVAHPLDGEGLELSDEDAAELSKNSAELHALREFRNWLPERAAIDEMLREIGQQLPSGDKPDAEAVQKLIQDGVAAATDRYFGPERRALLARRLKDSALSVLATEGESRALELVATIKVIEKAGLITDPPRDVAFLRAFFEKAIATLAHQGGGRLQVPVTSPAAAGDAGLAGTTSAP
jgi:hypothetical protein